MGGYDEPPDESCTDWTQFERNQKQRIAEPELQQARYDASLAERRRTTCDPGNRPITAQLEKSSEAALHRAQACEALSRTPYHRRAFSVSVRSRSFCAAVRMY